MVFSAANFLFLFLPLALATYYAARALAGQHGALVAIFASSLLFYFWSAGWDTGYLVALIGLGFAASFNVRGPRGSSVLKLVIALDLGLLLWFKYAHFIAHNLDLALGSTLDRKLGPIALPAGVSFFVFQAISYLVDVKRGELEPEPSMVRYGAYQAFFAHLVAGPIVRYRDIADDLSRPQLGVERFGAGAARFAHGLAKKVLIADGVAPVADAVFGTPAALLSPASAWLGTLAYTLQIYFDFSGYSDMAIGLAMMFGVRFHENFDRPYSSASLSEFWRRWHISLSSWFRDYVYIPLGGSRGGRALTYRNLLIVFALTGLWHGAAWQFLAWGLFHGAFLVGERLLVADPAKSMRHPALRFGYCLPVVMFGWVLFRAPDLPSAMGVWAQLARVVVDHRAVAPYIAATLSPHALAALAAGAAVLCAPRGARSIGSVLMADRPTPSLWNALDVAYAGAALFTSGTLMLTGNFSPFLYFRF